MGKVIQLKTGHNQQVKKQAVQDCKDYEAKKRLADWLRNLANQIEADAPQVEPLAAVVVLTGRTANEVLNMGYDNDAVDFEQACKSTMRRYAVRSTDMHIFSV